MIGNHVNVKAFRGFESLLLRHMKTPLKSEPLRFGRRWCFCYKFCIDTDSGIVGFSFQPGQENQENVK